MQTIGNGAKSQKKLILITLLYLTTSFVGWLASANEGHLGLIGSYLLCASVILSWISKSKWSMWVPVVGSALLVCYFLAADMRIYVKHSSALSPLALIQSLLFLGLLILTLLVSLMRLRAAPSGNAGAWR